MDCTDIRALLSGLIDDEVDAPARHAAERHLAECPRCRSLIDEAEALDELVHADVASRIDSRGLPTGFEGAVIGRTLYENGRGGYLRHWTTWAGWVAAAAALALSVTLWVQDRRPSPVIGPTLVPPSSGGEVLQAGYGTTLRSWTLDEAFEAEPYAPASAAPLTRDDADALYFAAVLLGMVASPDVDLEQVREAVRYDRLVPKLRRVRDRLASTDLAVVLATEALLLEVVEGPIDGNDLESMRTTIRAMDLAGTLELMSEQWDRSNAL
jgi:hypothetical protein